MSSAACASAREVPPGGSPNLTSAEGLVVIAGDTENPLDVRLCRDDVYCASAELTSEKSVAVLATQAGRYCITRLHQQTYEGASGISHEPRNEDAACFDVVPAAITYFGHVSFATDAIGNTAWNHSRWSFPRRDDAIRGQLDVAFPHLKDFRLHTVRLQPRG